MKDDSNLNHYKEVAHLRNIITETDKAYQIELNDEAVWIPKKLCKMKNGRIFLWEKMYDTKIQEIKDRIKKRPKEGSYHEPKQKTVDGGSLDEHLRWHDRELDHNDFNFVPDRE